LVTTGRRTTSGARPAKSGPAGAVARRAPLRLLRNLALAAAVFLILFAIAGFFIVPPVAKYYLVKTLSEQLGRPVAIADIDLNPFAMKVRVEGLRVQEPGASAAFVAFDELLFNLEYRSLLRWAPVVKQIRITNPYVHIVRNPDGSTYNFSDLVDKFSKGDASPQPKSQARFSLNNIELVNGRVEFEDKPKQARHTVSEINVAIPFISNLPDTVDEYVQPSFSARVNGTPVALSGHTKPFADTLESSLDLNIDRLDLTRYVEYVPVKLNFRLGSGFLDTRLTASFVREKSRPPVVLVRGSVGLETFSLSQLDGKPLFNLAALTVPVEAIDVFGRKAEIGKVAVTAPEVFVRRDRDGRLNWISALPSSDAPKDSAPENANGAGVSLAVKEVALHDGQVHVEDAVPATPFRSDLLGIEAVLHDFALPQSAPARAELGFRTRHGESVQLAAALTVQPLSAEGTLEAQQVRLKTYAPYYADLILYNVEDGVADLKTAFALRSAPDSPPQVRLSAFNLGLASVRLRKPGMREDFLRVKSAQISDAAVDVNRLALDVGAFATRDGFLNLIRERDGALNATRILPASKETRAAQREGTPWLVTLNRAEIARWKVAFTDEALPEPVHVVADEVRLTASRLSNRRNRKGQVALQARLNQSGALKVAGPVALNPVSAELAVELTQLGLVPLQPYFTEKLNVLLTSADVSVKGTAKLATSAEGALNAAYAGDVRLTDLASVDKAKSEDLLKWRSLDISGIDFTQSPPALSIQEVALADFFARIIVYPEARLNLQDIVVQEQAKAANGTAASSAGGDAAPAASRAPAGGATQATTGASAAPIRIARISLQGGDVNFTDLFIKPNYSANLSEIGGSVVGLSSELNTTADVDLRGRFAKTAPVEISGKVNPLIDNLFLDIRASVRDIELGPFTPYSGKYVGYAIEKGKMAFAVEYKVQNRQLSAQNKLVLNQLTFGEKVESPDAIKLPVLLAVALLKDRNGVIDVNLPISGSVDDPKFSVGGIIWRVIVNLLEKAVTAPFALIGNMLGGGAGEELSYLEFDAGRSTLSSVSEDKVAKLQTALVERPALKLDISGRYDPQTDREGLRRYRFEQQVKAQKLNEQVKKGAAVKSVDDVQIDPAEYEKYLERAYRAAKFPKPRNVLGFTKDLPKEEMEKLMLTNTQVTESDLLELANRRAQAAKDAITRENKVEVERVFLLAPRPAEAKADAKASRVDFSLK
jgi:hypothetical protein